MEQHPVPQNITSFEFRLIGDMTIRQFGFLAIGAVLAFIFWELPLPSFIRVPTSSLLAFTGVAFAFLPYEDRPLHRWALAFFRSIYSPTQYLFRKSEAVPLYLRPDFPAATQKLLPTFQVRESRQKLEEYLKTLPKNIPTALEAKESASLTKIQALMATIAALSAARASMARPAAIPVSSHLDLKLRGEPLSSSFPPSAPAKKLAFAEEGRLLFEEEKKNIPVIPYSPEKIASRSEILIEEIKRLKGAIAALHTSQPSPQTPAAAALDYQERLVTLEKQLEQVEDEKEALMRMMLKLQKEMTSKPKGVTPTEVLEKTQAVKIISAQAAKEIGLPRLTTTPNIITGVVQDKRGIFLPNILVEIKDKDGDAVRAFKTNKLGQFAAATPLANGTYTLELEDPRRQFVFDIIEVEIDGSVLPPLAIYAKSQIDLEREKIKNSLFGTTD